MELKMGRRTESRRHILEDGTGPIEYPTQGNMEQLVFEKSDKHERPAFYHFILLNRTFRIVLVTAGVALCLPMVFYLVFYSREWGSGFTEKEYGTCGYYDVYHLPCGIKDTKRLPCELRGCCFNDKYGCYHSLPSRTRYQMSGENWSPGEELKPVYGVTPLERDSIPEYKLHVNEISPDTAEIVLYNPRVHSFGEGTVNPAEDSQFDIKVFSPVFYVEMYRKTEHQLLFSTARGPLIASDKYFEWSMFLNADYLVGLGASVLREEDTFLLLDNEVNTTVPLVLAYNVEKRAYHGIQFSASAPVEIRIKATKLITVRGFQPDLFRVLIFTGPTPMEVHRQAKNRLPAAAVPFQLSYWHLGLHVCSEANSVEEAVDELTQMLQSQHPFDSHCVMNNLVWLSDDGKLPANIRDAISELRRLGKRFVASVVALIEHGNSPAHTSAEEKGILMKSLATGDTYNGLAYGRRAAYVDFKERRETALEWLRNVWAPKLAEIAADGYHYLGTSLPDDSPEAPQVAPFPFVPEYMATATRNLTTWTSIADPALETLVLMYQNDLTNAALEAFSALHGKDDWLVGSGTSGVASRFQPVSEATWTSFQSDVETLVSSAFAGVVKQGSVVCGSHGFRSRQEELCVRWYQFASLTPLFKVPSERFADKFDENTQRIMDDTVRRRYKLLGYMASVLLQGQPLLRPLYFDFQETMPVLENVTHQFMLGPSLMVVPVTWPLVKHVAIYFPDDFYELWGGLHIRRTSFRGDPINFPVVLSDVPAFLKSGHIIAMHDSDNSLSADESRKQHIFLKLGLKCIEAPAEEIETASRCEATGDWLISDSMKLTFKSTEHQLTILVESTAPARQMMCDPDPVMSDLIEWVDLYGYPGNSMPVSAKINLKLCGEEDWSKPISVSYQFITS